MYLVADHYSPAIEHAAWRARATLFGVKGGHAHWLDDWLQCQPGRSAKCAALAASDLLEITR